MNTENFPSPAPNSKSFTFSDAIQWSKTPKPEKQHQFNIWLIISLIFLLVIVCYIIMYYSILENPAKKSEESDSDGE